MAEELDFFKAMRGGSGYIRDFEARRNAEADAARFAQMAQQYGATIPQDQAGPTRPPGMDFAIQAAQIPSYQQYASQLMGQMQNRAGNMDSLTFARDNMTAAQAASLAEQQRQFGQLSAYQKSALGLQGQQQAQQAAQWGSISPYQQAMLGMQQRELDQRGQAARAVPAGALPGSPLFDAQMSELNQYEQAMGAVDKLKGLWGQTGFAPGVFDRDKLKEAGPYKMQVMGSMSKLLGSGTLNQGESELFEKALSEPSFFSSNKNTTAALEALKKALTRSAEDVRKRNPYLPGSGGGGGGGAPAGFSPVGR